MNVVFYGQPLAGKFSILQAIAEARSWKGEAYGVAPEGQAIADRAFRVFAGDGSASAATLPGCPWSMATWDLLLQSADGIVVVADPQEGLMDLNREHVAHLGDLRRRVIGLQVTKVDLVGRERAELVAKTLASEFSLDVPIALSTFRDRASTCALYSLLVTRPSSLAT